MSRRHLAFSALLIVSIAFIPFYVHADSVNQVTSTSTHVLLHDSFVLQAFSDTCYYKHYAGTMPAGARIYGIIKSDIPISFYIMNDTQFNHKSNLCFSLGGSDMVLGTLKVTSYALNWTVPTLDKYHFLILNTATSDASVSITLWTL
jgi:hypothetical protein